MAQKQQVGKTLQHSGLDSQQQSKPHLPKNANITGNLLINNDQTYETQQMAAQINKIPKVDGKQMKTIKLTQDQINRRKSISKQE
jgi:phage-related protein